MEEIIFSVTTEMLQDAAQTQINRNLTIKKLEKVKRGVEYGLMCDLHAILSTAIENSISDKNSEKLD